MCGSASGHSAPGPSLIKRPLGSLKSCLRSVCLSEKIAELSPALTATLFIILVQVLFGTQIDASELDSPLLSPTSPIASPIVVRPARRPVRSAAALRDELNSIKMASSKLPPLQVGAHWKI